MGLQKRVLQAALARAPTPPLPHWCGPHGFPDWCTWQPGAAWGKGCDPRFPSPEVVDSLKSKHCLVLGKQVGPTLNGSRTLLQTTKINYIYTCAHERTRTQLRPLQIIQICRLSLGWRPTPTPRDLRLLQGPLPGSNLHLRTEMSPARLLTALGAFLFPFVFTFSQGVTYIFFSWGSFFERSWSSVHKILSPVCTHLCH